MPTVAIVDGIKIELYYDDHVPPHFHARSAGSVAVIDIKTLGVKKGSLPPSQKRAVLNWAKSREDRLLAAWYACRLMLDPGKVE